MNLRQLTLFVLFILAGVAGAVYSIVYSVQQNQVSEVEAHVEKVLDAARGGEEKLSIYFPESVIALTAEPKLAQGIEHLTFWSHEFDGLGQAPLEVFENIESLGFYCCGQFDKLFPAITRMPKLKTVAFETCEMPVDLLAKLPHLSRVVYTDRGVSPEYRAKFKRRLPNVELVETLD